MDPFLIPVQIIIIVIYIFRIPIANKISTPSNPYFTRFVVDIKFGVGKWWKTILLPILTILVIYFLWIFYNAIWFHQFPISPISDSISFYIMDSLILAPITEEILQCFPLSCIFVLSTVLFKNKWKIAIVNLAGLLIISFIFLPAHSNLTPTIWFLRFFLFIIYGAMYYLNNRNLLPAVLSHSVWNLVTAYPFMY